MWLKTAVSTLVVMTSTVALAQDALQPPGADLMREGTGARRDALDKMERQPFDQTLWSKLTDWSNGDALNADSTQGKVVVIYTWASYLPTSMRPMATLARLQEKYSDEGLLVVGVHQDFGWEDAATEAQRRHASFRIARDAGGSFRDALKVDQDPDFYLIDRAGQMRFADLDTSSLTSAVELLIKETPEEARTLNERLKDARHAAAVEFGRTRDIRQAVRLSDIPELPFAQPSEDAYQAAQWPKIKDDDDDRRNSRRDQPAVIHMPQYEGAFFPQKPNFKGRVTVAYFCSPKLYQTYSFLDEANRLQKAHERDVVVLGVMTPVKYDERSRRRHDDDQDVSSQDFAKEFTEFAQRRAPEHTLVADASAQFAQALEQGSRGRDSGVFKVGNMPYVAIVSSDGVVRWHGPANSRWFSYMLDGVLRVDPGVQARRSVETEYRRTHPSGG